MKDIESHSKMLIYKELWKEGNVKKGGRQKKQNYAGQKRDCVEDRRQIFQRKQKKATKIQKRWNIGMETKN